MNETKARQGPQIPSRISFPFALKKSPACPVDLFGPHKQSAQRGCLKDSICYPVCQTSWMPPHRKLWGPLVCTLFRGSFWQPKEHPWFPRIYVSPPTSYHIMHSPRIVVQVPTWLACLFAALPPDVSLSLSQNAPNSCYQDNNSFRDHGISHLSHKLYEYSHTHLHDMCTPFRPLLPNYNASQRPINQGKGGGRASNWVSSFLMNHRQLVEINCTPDAGVVSCRFGLDSHTIY